MFRTRSAILDDIAFMMATERLPGYDKLVGRFSEDQHERAMTDPAFAYFIAEMEEVQVGFALVQYFDDEYKYALIRRVAVARTGKGLGKQLVSSVVAQIFTTTDHHRITIGCFPTIIRARKCYESVGFRPELIARGKVLFEGEPRDELQLALLRRDFPVSPL